MDEKTAYRAMFYFLEQYYARGKSDEIGDILGGLALLEDGGSADPAYWHDWLEAIEKAKIDTEGVKFKIVKE